MRLNRTKTEAVRLGKLKATKVPTIDITSGINWVKPGKWITILGYPFGESPDINAFWEAKYFKCKCLLLTPQQNPTGDQPRLPPSELVEAHSHPGADRTSREGRQVHLLTALH